MSSQLHLAEERAHADDERRLREQVIRSELHPIFQRAYNKDPLLLILIHQRQSKLNDRKAKLQKQMQFTRYNYTTTMVEIKLMGVQAELDALDLEEKKINERIKIKKMEGIE